MALLIVIIDVLYIISVFSLKSGKLTTTKSSILAFLASISYIITMLITGF